MNGSHEATRWTVGLFVAALPGLVGAQAPRSFTSQPNLSPQKAAQASLVVEEKAPVKAVRASTAPGTSERTLSEGIDGLVRASDATVSEKGTRVLERGIWTVLAPWKQRRNAKPVRYWYIGQSVDAEIYSDGSVLFLKKRGLALSPVAASSVEGELPGRAGSDAPAAERFGSPTAPGVGVGVADPGRAWGRVVTGKEPPNAEARTFIERTKPLRGFLEANAQAAEMARADKEMQETLERLWSRPAQRREQIFALWDGCAEDETGGRGRAQIEAFLRERAQDAGSCLFSARDIERFNGRRKSKLPFAPCAPEDAGPPHDERRVSAPPARPPERARDGLASCS